MKSLDTLSKETIKLLRKNKILYALIKSEFIKDTLENIHVEKKEEEILIKKMLERYGVKDPENIESWLKENHLSQEELKSLALADVRLKKYCDENFKHKVNARFLERKSQLDIVVYSLVRVKDKFKAEEIYMQIAEGEADIGDLATKYSQGPEKNTRGIIGPLPLEKAHPILAKQLKNSKVGVVQPPIQIDKLYIVCRVEYFHPAQLDEIMHEKMAIEIFDKWVETNTNEIRERLLNKLFSETTK